MKKQHIIAAVIALCIGGGVFYGGMQYEKNVAAKSQQTNGRNFAGGNRQGGSDQTGGQRVAGQSGGGMRRGGANGGGFVTGEILSKDDKSLTIKTTDGGSTIVYFSPTVVVRKAETGSLSDLATGQQVVVNGKSNSDGSLSADTVQITPKTN